jgi:hypothetical protein
MATTMRRASAARMTASPPGGCTAGARTRAIGRTLAMGLLLVAAAARPAAAQDAFEIQVYDAETAPKWHPGIETHFNYDISGLKEPASPGLLPTDHVFHLTFEPHLGLASWCEAGFYVQTALHPDGTFRYAGFKGRFKARVPFRILKVLGLALNTELAVIPSIYETSRVGAELRPIADLKLSVFYLAVNPIIGFDFEGADAGRPLFEPAAKAAIWVVPSFLALGGEYYGFIGPLNAPLPRSQQVHRLFAAVDLALNLKVVQLNLNVGVGYGLAAGEPWIAKAILGMEFGSNTNEEIEK